MSRHDRLRLMLLSGCAADTLRRFERGQPIREASRRRILEAALVLGIDLPPERASD